MLAVIFSSLHFPLGVSELYKWPGLNEPLIYLSAGHVRSFCILGARLVKENRNAIITIIVAPNLLSKAQTEILAELGDESFEAAWRRIRCVKHIHSKWPQMLMAYILRVLSSFQSNSQSIFVLTPLAIETYSAVYKALSRAESVSCAVTGVKYDAISAPNVVILSVGTITFEIDASNTSNCSSTLHTARC